MRAGVPLLATCIAFSAACPELIVCNTAADCPDNTECGADNRCAAIRGSGSSGNASGASSGHAASSGGSSTATGTTSIGPGTTSNTATSGSASSAASSTGGGCPDCVRIVLNVDGTGAELQPDGEDIYFCDRDAEFRRVSITTGTDDTYIHDTCAVIDHAGHGYYRASVTEGDLMEIPLVADAEATQKAPDSALISGNVLAVLAEGFLFATTADVVPAPSMFRWTSGGGVVPLTTGRHDFLGLVIANGYVAWTDLAPSVVASVPLDGSEAQLIEKESNENTLGSIVGVAVGAGSFFWGWNAGASNEQIGVIRKAAHNASPGSEVTTLAEETLCGFECITGFTADDTHVYWTSADKLAVRRVSFSTGQVETVVQPTLCPPWQIVQQGERIYWLEACGDVVLVVRSKPGL